MQWDKHFAKGAGRRKAIGSVLAATVVASYLVLGSAPASSAATLCSDVLFYGVRGSGEAQDPGLQRGSDAKNHPVAPETNPGYGMGARVWRIYREWRVIVPEGVTVGVGFAPYQALSVDALNPPGGIRKAITRGWWNYISDWWYGTKPDTGIAAFSSSAQTGADATLTALTNLHRQCPDTKIVLAGYSQGAMAIHQALVDMVSGDTEAQGAAAAVIGVFELADGDRLPTTSARDYGSAKSDASGVRTYAHMTLQDAGVPIPSEMPPLTEAIGNAAVAQICNEGDIVCDVRKDTIKQSSLGKRIHSDYDLGNAPEITNAVLSMQSSLNASTPNSGRYMSLGSQLPTGTVGTPYSGGITYNTQSSLSIVQGTSLPFGLAMDPTGHITGTPTAAGTYRFTVQAQDPYLRTVRRSFTITIGDAGQGTGGGPSAAAVSAGAQHSCAVLQSGAVKCWGDNSVGQLGDGTYTSPSPLPVQVQTLTSGVVSVAAAAAHSCALTNSGAVKCWGDNESGMLGDGTLNTSPVPVQVQGLDSGVTSLAVGWTHSCAVLDSGGVMCWGHNYDGELGNGTSGPSPLVPVQVQGLTSGVKQVVGGLSHSCALLSSGAVECWGRGGELGDGTTTSSYVPVPVQGLSSGVVAISAFGGNTCALRSGGTVMCWGSAYLGDGTLTYSLVPVQVQGLNSAAIAVAAGPTHTCVVLTDGSAWCWGRNFYGELGDGTLADALLPVRVVGLTTSVVGISAGYRHTCAVLDDNSVKCWGLNGWGQLGDGSYTNSLVPVSVQGLP